MLARGLTRKNAFTRAGILLAVSCLASALWAQYPTNGGTYQPPQSPPAKPPVYQPPTVPSRSAAGTSRSNSYEGFGSYQRQPSTPPRTSQTYGGSYRGSAQGAAQAGANQRGTGTYQNQNTRPLGLSSPQLRNSSNYNAPPQTKAGAPATSGVRGGLQLKSTDLIQKNTSRQPSYPRVATRPGETYPSTRSFGDMPTTRGTVAPSRPMVSQQAGGDLRLGSGNSLSNVGGGGSPSTAATGQNNASGFQPRRTLSAPNGQRNNVAAEQFNNPAARTGAQGIAVPGNGSRPGATRVPVVQRPAGGQPMRQPLAPQVKPPEWAGKLPPAHDRYVDQILAYWQMKTEEIHSYECKFRRWEWDTVFGPKSTYKTFSEGEIRYETPDKGLFHAKTVKSYHAPTDKEAAKFAEVPGVFGEHWVCDGKNVYEYDYSNKRILERQLPPHMQGKLIASGPLPFLFGASAKHIKERFWLRVVTPQAEARKPEDQRTYWLEAYPKRSDDAASYLKVVLIIDYQEYLPKGMMIFDRTYNPPANQNRVVFEFYDRKLKKQGSFLDGFQRPFYRVRPDYGWTLQPVMMGNASTPQRK